MKHSAGILLLVLMTLSAWVTAGSLDEDAVVSTIEDNARVNSAYPRTLDDNSVLKQYTPDATVISNGVFVTVQHMKESMAQVAEMVNLGTNIGLSIKATDIKVQLLQSGFAFVTYDSTYKVASSGTVLEEQSEKCSGLYKKIGPSWLIWYEHCSSLKPKKEEPAPEDQKPRRKKKQPKEPDGAVPLE